jgi:hypothetical protein
MSAMTLANMRANGVHTIAVRHGGQAIYGVKSPNVSDVAQCTMPAECNWG